MLQLNKTYLIDCVQGMTEISDNSADVVLIDPPYNIGKDFGNNSDKQTMHDYLLWCDTWIKEAIRILKDDGTLYIYGFSEILAEIFVRVELNKRWLVWHYKNKNSAHETDWQRSHESILVGWKKDRIFNIDDIRIPYTKTYLKNAVGKKRKSTKGRFGSKETIYKAHSGGAKPRDVIEVAALAGGAGANERYSLCKTCNEIFFKSEAGNIHDLHNIIIHPTQKPMDLTYQLLKAAIKKDKTNLVVIPFAGTGSELIVCKDLNLDFIAFEINEDYVQMINLILNANNFQKTHDAYSFF